MAVWKYLFGSAKKDQVVERSPYLPKEKLPPEILFRQTFTQKGGEFISVLEKEDLKNTVSHTFEKNGWSTINGLCLEKSLAEELELTYYTQKRAVLSFDVLVMNCEFLVSNTGSILVSEHQIKDYKLEQLPEVFMIIAHTCQLVNDVSEGMSKLNLKYGKKIPSNITGINVKSNATQANFMVSGNTSKNISLLLQESPP